MFPEKIFGEKQPGIEYPDRIGAYALPFYFDELRQEFSVLIAKVSILHDSQPRYQLIGGAMEENDGGDHLNTLTREILEETGYSTLKAHYLGQVKEIVNGRTMKFWKHGHYYAVELGEKILPPIEDNHCIELLPLHEAVRRIPHESSKFVLLEYQKRLLESRDKKITPPFTGEL